MQEKDWELLLLHDFTHCLLIMHNQYHAKINHIQGSKNVPANPDNAIQRKHSKFLKNNGARTYQKEGFSMMPEQNNFKSSLKKFFFLIP